MCHNFEANVVIRYALHFTCQTQDITWRRSQHWWPLSSLGSRMVPRRHLVHTMRIRDGRLIQVSLFELTCSGPRALCIALFGFFEFDTSILQVANYLRCTDYIFIHYKYTCYRYIYIYIGWSEDLTNLCMPQMVCNQNTLRSIVHNFHHQPEYPSLIRTRLQGSCECPASS